jgi:hypothetical protein
MRNQAQQTDVYNTDRCRFQEKQSKEQEKNDGRASSAGVVLGYWLDHRRIVVQLQAGARGLYPIQNPTRF